MSVVLCIILLQTFAHTQALPKDSKLKAEIKKGADAELNQTGVIEREITKTNVQDTNPKDLNLNIKINNALDALVNRTDDTQKVPTTIEPTVIETTTSVTTKAYDIEIKLVIDNKQTYITQNVTGKATKKTNEAVIKLMNLDVDVTETAKVQKLITATVTSTKTVPEVKQNNFKIVKRTTDDIQKVLTTPVTFKTNVSEIKRRNLDIYGKQADNVQKETTPSAASKINVTEVQPNNLNVYRKQANFNQKLIISPITIKTNIIEIKENNIDIEEKQTQNSNSGDDGQKVSTQLLSIENTNQDLMAQSLLTKMPNIQVASSIFTNESQTICERLKFTDFLESLIEVIKTFEDKELANLANTFNQEIIKCNHDNCAFDELFRDFSNRNYITHKMRQFKNLPATDLREKLNVFQKKLQSENVEDETKYVIDYVNNITYKDSQYKLMTVLNNFKVLSNETNRSAGDFENLIKEEMKTIFFDHYSGLDRQIQLGLVKLLNGYIRPMDENVQRSFKRWHPENNIHELAEDYFGSFDLDGIRNLLDHKIVKREIEEQTTTGNILPSTTVNAKAENVKIETKNDNINNIINNQEDKHNPSTVTEVMPELAVSSPIDAYDMTTVTLKKGHKNKRDGKKSHKPKKRRRRRKRRHDKHNATFDNESVGHDGFNALETGNKLEDSSFRESNSTASLQSGLVNIGPVGNFSRRHESSIRPIFLRQRNKYRGASKKRPQFQQFRGVANNKLQNQKYREAPNNKLQKKNRGKQNHIGVNVDAHVSVGVGVNGYGTIPRKKKKQNLQYSDDSYDSEYADNRKPKYNKAVEDDDGSDDSSSDDVDYYDFKPTKKRRQPTTRRGRFSTRTWRRTTRRRRPTTQAPFDYGYDNGDYNNGNTQKTRRTRGSYTGRTIYVNIVTKRCKGPKCKCKNGKCTPTNIPYNLPDKDHTTLPLNENGKTTPISPDGDNPDGGDPDGGNAISPDGNNPDNIQPDENGDTTAIPLDGGNPDGGNPDGGNPDGGNPDGGNPDGGNPDGGNLDGGNPDYGNPDGGNPDGGNPDGDNPDGGNLDDDNPDGGNPDGGDLDGGNLDGANPDGGDPDGGNPDGGNPDGVDPDGGNPDGVDPDGVDPDEGIPDEGNPDGNNPNRGDPDGGNLDEGNPDGGNPDGGNSDGGNPDGGHPDGGNPDGGGGGNIDIDININGKINNKIENVSPNTMPSSDPMTQFDKDPDVKLTSPGENLISTQADGELQPGKGLDDHPGDEPVPDPEPVENPPDSVNPEVADGEVAVPEGEGQLPTEHPADIVDLVPATPDPDGKDSITLPSDSLTLPDGVTLPDDGPCQKCKEMPRYTLIIQNEKFKIKFEIMRNKKVNASANAPGHSKLSQSKKKDCPLAEK